MARDSWRRPPYEVKTLEQASFPRWALGCERCNYGTVRGTFDEYCTCQAGQARRRWATGQIDQGDATGAGRQS